MNLIPQTQTYNDLSLRLGDFSINPWIIRLISQKLNNISANALLITGLDLQATMPILEQVYDSIDLESVKPREAWLI